MQKITTCLWFDTQAEEAVTLYTSIFKKSKVGATARYDEEGAKVSGRPAGSVMTVAFKILGYEFMALNGGPMFKFTPAISFIVHCKTKRSVDNLFKKLSEGGEIMMPLDKYPFSERYAFIKDKFGVAWQLMLSPAKPHLVPALLFVGDKLGRAEDAINHYTSIFKESKVNTLRRYEAGEPHGKLGTVKFASFNLEGQEFSAMDGEGPHQFTFNEAVSFMVNCKNQEELDYYWEKLSAVPESEQCGWLKDKFGVSWQIIPKVMEKLMKDPAKSEKVMKAMLQMKKLNIKELKKAVKGK